NPTVNAPVTVCGNSVSVIGRDYAQCHTVNPGGGHGSGDNRTSGRNGGGSGNQITPTVNAPVTVCGNAVSVIGRSSAHCETHDQGGPSGDNRTNGDGGVLSGNQINPTVNAPVTVCGNAVAVIG